MKADTKKTLVWLGIFVGCLGYPLLFPDTPSQRMTPAQNAKLDSYWYKGPPAPADQQWTTPPSQRCNPAANPKYWTGITDEQRTQLAKGWGPSPGHPCQNNWDSSPRQ